MADVTIFGLSTLGITFGYGVETTAGTKPTSFTRLHRVSSIGEVTAEPEAIDVSTLEDYDTKYAEGRTQVADTLAVTVNWTDETLDEWEDLMDAYDTAKAGGKRMWFEVVVPEMTKGCFVVGAPPAVLPLPSLDQNDALVNAINITVQSFEGWDTKVSLTQTPMTMTMTMTAKTTVEKHPNLVVSGHNKHGLKGGRNPVLSLCIQGEGRGRDD